MSTPMSFLGLNRLVKPVHIDLPSGKRLPAVTRTEEGFTVLGMSRAWPGMPASILTGPDGTIRVAAPGLAHLLGVQVHPGELAALAALGEEVYP